MPLITISRGIGCGGMIIAQQVSKGLNAELFDDLRLQQEAVKMGLRPEELKGLDEKAPGFFDLVLSKRPEIYLDYMEALIYEVAKSGTGVIIGHGSQMLLRDFECALHVYIHAGESMRIRNLTSQMGVSEEVARKLISKKDHEQKGFFRYAFHKDWNDPALYDLIINTDQIGLDLAAKVIMEVAGSDQIKECSLTAIEAMEKEGLKKKIQAALLKEDIDLLWLNIEIPGKGLVNITGVVQSIQERDRIPEILTGVPGVLKLNSNVVGPITQGV
jgi:cytidylate kinase